MASAARSNASSTAVLFGGLDDCSVKSVVSANKSDMYSFGIQPIASANGSRQSFSLSITLRTVDGTADM
jgi:hypothetical protein